MNRETARKSRQEIGNMYMGVMKKKSESDKTQWMHDGSKRDSAYDSAS